MIKDLQDTISAREHASADVVVIGGGIAGLLAATRLNRAGVRTIVLESGGASGTAMAHPLNAVVQVGQPYQGAEKGRFRGLGGTSVRWGGAMLPFLDCDMDAHTAGWPVDWPVGIDQLDGEFRELEALFQLPPGPFERHSGESGTGDAGAFSVRSAKWPQFGLRNVARVLSGPIESLGLEIWLNATVKSFELNESGRLEAVVAEAPSGVELRVQARIVVIAAGAIESTRLMLLLDAQNGQAIFEPHGLLGRYFFDHLSTPAAALRPSANAKKLNETFGLRFHRSGMRDVRIEASPELRRRNLLPGSFAHVAAISTTDGGFSALRGIYRDLQSGSSIEWANILGVSRDLGWLAEAAWWRIAKRVLLAPRHAAFQMVLVTEQFPHRGSSIGLSADKFDCHGNPLAKLDWQIHSRDFDAFRDLQSALVSYWKTSDFGRLAEIEPVPEDVWRDGLMNGSDIFHPGGTTRMGRTAASGVVDAELRAFQIPNLYVISTSVFPSGGSANPTFTLMALALRTADLIAREIGP